MTTIVPRLNMTDAELEALAERRGLELTMPAADARALLVEELGRLAARARSRNQQNAHPEK